MAEPVVSRFCVLCASGQHHPSVHPFDDCALCGHPAHPGDRCREPVPEHVGTDAPSASPCGCDPDSPVAFADDPWSPR